MVARRQVNKGDEEMDYLASISIQLAFCRGLRIFSSYSKYLEEVGFTYIDIYSQYRYDTRDLYIDPQFGVFLNIEFSGLFKLNNISNIYSIEIDYNIYKTLYKWNCRLINIDTPEIRTRNLREKVYGKKVRDYLRKKILNKIVTVSCKDFDKYGRLLVEIFYEDENINNWLIDNGYAKIYDGGTKHKWFAEDE